MLPDCNLLGRSSGVTASSSTVRLEVEIAVSCPAELFFCVFLLFSEFIEDPPAVQKEILILNVIIQTFLSVSPVTQSAEDDRQIECSHVPRGKDCRSKKKI